MIKLNRTKPALLMVLEGLYKLLLRNICAIARLFCKKNDMQFTGRK